MKIVRFKFCESYKPCKFLSWHKGDGMSELSCMNVPLIHPPPPKKTYRGQVFMSDG